MRRFTEEFDDFILTDLRYSVRISQKSRHCFVAGIGWRENTESEQCGWYGDRGILRIIGPLRTTDYHLARIGIMRQAIPMPKRRFS